MEDWIGITMFAFFLAAVIFFTYVIKSAVVWVIAIIMGSMKDKTMTDVGDVVFCRLLEPNGFGYWVIKEVSAIDRGGKITHVCPLGHPEAESKISIFAVCGIPKKKLGTAFKEALRRELQIDAAGRIPDEYVNSLFDMFEVRMVPT